MAERKGKRAGPPDRTVEDAATQVDPAVTQADASAATGAGMPEPARQADADADAPPQSPPSVEDASPADLSPRDEAPIADPVPEQARMAPAAAAAPAPQPSAGSFGTMLAGAVIGAALVGGGLGWFAWTKGAFEDLRPRLAALENASGAASNRTALTDLGNRIGAVEGRLETLARTAREAATLAPQDSARLSAAMQEAVASMKREVDGARAAAAEAMTAARAAQGRAASAVEASSAPRPLPGEAAARLEEIDRRLGELTGRRTDVLAARLVLAQRLQERVRLNAGFQPELEALRRLGADQGLLAVLAPFAAAGLPKPADLAAGLRAAAPPPPAPAPAAPAGLLDRLAANATSLVRIERADAPRAVAASDPLAAIIAAVQAGDDGKALATIAALAPERRAGLAEAAARIEARRKAVEAAHGLVEKSLADLGRGG
jgi:hypothetical protein